VNAALRLPDVREDHARYGRVVTQFNIKGE
jgi:uncharacterized membrane protein